MDAGLQCWLSAVMIFLNVLFGCSGFPFLHFELRWACWVGLCFKGFPKLDFWFQRFSLVEFGALKVYLELDLRVQKFLLVGIWVSGFILCWALVCSGVPR